MNLQSLVNRISAVHTASGDPDVKNSCKRLVAGITATEGQVNGAAGGGSEVSQQPAFSGNLLEECESINAALLAEETNIPGPSTVFYKAGVLVEANCLIAFVRFSS